MRLRYWVAEAKSGDIVGELRVRGNASFTSRFGGGTCRLPVSLSHLTTRDGSGADWGAVEQVLAWTRGGLHTVVVTDHQQRCLGEWVLMRRSRPAPDGVVTVQGMEWAGYPALRSLHDNYVYNGTDQLTIARALLSDAFVAFNAGMTITIPTATSGVGRTMDHKSHSAYYADLLDEISSPDDGFEWHVDVALSWSGGRPTKVTRTVAFGHPTLARSSALVLHQASPGSRRGNTLAVDGGDDFSRYAQSVYGIGAGEGGKQKWVGLSDPTLTNAGYLNSTKNVSFPGVKDTAALTKLTQGALVAAQDLRDPYSATALVDKLAAWPAVGRTARLLVDRTWNYPTGVDQTLRVGEVSFSPSGHQVSTVSVQAI